MKIKILTASGQFMNMEDADRLTVQLTFSNGNSTTQTFEDQRPLPSRAMTLRDVDGTELLNEIARRVELNR